MDRDTIIDGLRMTMELCVFDPSTGEEIEPHLLNDISRATYDACKGALEILERLPANNSEIPNSSDTISRAKAIEAINHELRCGAVIDQCGLETAHDLIEELPSTQLEHIRGHWIEIALSNHTYKCSVCGRLLVNITDGKNTVAKNYPYCHCGADMRGVTT